LELYNNSTVAGLFLNKPHFPKRKYTTDVKNLNPSYVTGFCDGEACFTVKVNRNSLLRTGWNVSLIFSIHLNVRDLDLLEQIKAFFGVGYIQINKDGSITYSVANLKDLTNVIIPHFCKYPLLTQKQADFELFRRLVELVNHKEHLTTEGIHKIISIRASINNGLSDKLKAYFSNIMPTTRPIVKLAKNIDPNWLAGFVDAEGSFIVSIYKSKTTTGYAIKLIFSISQNHRDFELLSSCVKFLNCGRVSEKPTTSSVELIITKFSDFENKIIPLFNKYPLFGTKLRDYEDFCKIALLIKHKAHLTNEGLEQIRLIKSGMNRRRAS
jgi:hypothetical protein